MIQCEPQFHRDKLRVTVDIICIKNKGHHFRMIYYVSSKHHNKANT